MKESPKILGRTAQNPNEVDERAATELKAVGEKGFDCCASGQIIVEVFESCDNEDRGGTVLRIRSIDTDCAFIPTSVNIPNGVELHMAGEAESEAFRRALTAALQTHGR